MKPLPHLIKEFSAPSVRQFHIAIAPASSALFHVLELVLDSLRNPPALDQMAMDVLARRVGAHAFGGGGEVLAQPGVAGTMPALEASKPDWPLGPGDEAIGLGECRGLELRHE